MSSSINMYLTLFVCLTFGSDLFGMVQDTVPIASSNKRVVFDQTKSWAIVPIKADIGHLPQGVEYQIWFEGVRIDAPADGVYTVFLSARKMNFSAGPKIKPVGILDLYSFTAKGKEGNISVSVSDILPRLTNGMKGKSKKVYVYLLFEGNQMPDGRQSPHQGKIQFESVKLGRI